MGDAQLQEQDPSSAISEEGSCGGCRHRGRRGHLLRSGWEGKLLMRWRKAFSLCQAASHVSPCLRSTAQGSVPGVTPAACQLCLLVSSLAPPGCQYFSAITDPWLWCVPLAVPMLICYLFAWLVLLYPGTFFRSLSSSCLLVFLHMKGVIFRLFTKF